jgi:hypothetical protein
MRRGREKKLEVKFEDSVYAPKDKLNPHINFAREGKKTNARKVPTPVKCYGCNKIFTLPFKPRRPEVYCDDCFKFKKNHVNKK